jgi:hypothetical protein
VANGFVQHDARPAGSKNHIHLAGWRRRRVEVDQRLPYGFVAGALPLGGRKEIGEAPAPTIAVTASLLPIPLTDDHRDVHTHQRTYIAIALAVPAQDLDHLPACAE